MAASPAAAVGVVAAASAAVASAAATLVHWTCFVYTRDAALIVYLLLVSLVIYLCLRFDFVFFHFCSLHFVTLVSDSDCDCDVDFGFDCDATANSTRRALINDCVRRWPVAASYIESNVAMIGLAQHAH